MENNEVIKIENLSFAYNGSLILENVNLAIDRNDFASILGPNGGGKTTLLKIMLGLLRPNKGTIKILGLSPEQAHSKIGYVPQSFQFDRQFPVRVNDVVLMGRLGRPGGLGPFKKSDKSAAIDALHEVGLSELVTRPFSELSGGQRQRVLVARALVTDPEILLLDEPAAGMDVAIQEEFYALLKMLTQRLTVVLVTHDIGFVSTFVNRVVCVNREVVVHPTSEITGEMIYQLYGSDVRLVRHDHRCAEGGHESG